MEMVTVVGALAWPTPVRPEKETEAGLNAMAPVIPPMPVSETEAEPSAQVELIVSCPVKVPEEIGVKTMPTVQVAPPGRLVEQVLALRLNGAEMERLRPVAVAALVLVMMTVCAALAWLRA